MQLNLNNNIFERVFVVGAGMVGATTAYTLMLEGLAAEIILLDIQPDVANAQALDIQHASSNFKTARVRAGDYNEIKLNDLVIVTGGMPRKDGQTRLDLLKINYEIVKSIVANISAHASAVNLLMVTNPVDVLTYLASQMPELGNSTVIGSGTLLDSKRLWTELINSGLTEMQARKTLVIGEHGDSSITLYSQLEPENIPSEGSIEEINERVKQAGQTIIQGKKATYFGIAAAVSKIVSQMCRPTDEMVPISVVPNGQYGLQNLALGLPVRFKADGYEIVELEISAAEAAALQKSADTIKQSIAVCA